MDVDMTALGDEEKQQLMNEVYDEQAIKETQFYRDFKFAYELLDLGFEADNKSQAQDLFREIAQVKGIPNDVYNENDKLIDELIQKLKSKNFSLHDRLMANYELEKFTLSVPVWKKKGSVEKQPMRVCKTRGGASWNSGADWV